MPRPERSSPVTVTTPLETAKRKLYLVNEDRAEKKRQTFLVTFAKHVNALMDDLELPLEFEKQRDELRLKMRAARPFPADGADEFDEDHLTNEPEFRIERLPVRGVVDTYVSVESVCDKKGNASETVHPDGHGAYPDPEDLKAAMKRNFFLVRGWMRKGGILPEDAALIMHSYNPKPKEWLLRAMESLCAASSGLEPGRAAIMATTVIKDLVSAHRNRMETV